MRFLYIKNEQNCFHCGNTMLYGDEAVVIRIKHRNGYIIPQFFHPQCFLDWNNVSFMDRLVQWRLSATRRPERKRIPKTKKVIGRPKEYKNPILARRLLSLIYYYKKADNEAKVKELTELLLTNRV